MAERIRYSGYDIVPQSEDHGWAAWILYRDVPHARITGKASAAAAVAAAKQAIDRWEAERHRK